MSLSNKYHPTPLFILFISLLLLATQIACSPTQREGIIQLGESISNEVDQSLAEPSDLVFAGQVEDENGRWLNNCVVVLFKNGIEVKRTVSRLMESPFSNNGPMDGVFELRIPNRYKLTLAHEFYYPDRNLIAMRTASGLVGVHDLGTWFADLNPNDMRLVNVPDKQLEYALVVLPMPQNELPESYASGKLSLEGGLLITNQSDAVGNENLAAVATAVPSPTPKSNVQFTVLPSQNNGLDWHLQMTGYYGNRWDVWERFIAGRVPGMTWESFKLSVLSHNPHLEQDGFVFYPDKTYRLPMNQ